MDVKFDPTNFNKNFELNEQKNSKEKKKKIEVTTDIGVQYELLPHKQPIENLILDIRDTFFQVLNLVEDKQNPIPYIYSSSKRQFSFSLFLIIFGTLLLLLSSLMKSPNEK
jgi:hypothetical protein